MLDLRPDADKTVDSGDRTWLRLSRISTKNAASPRLDATVRSASILETSR
jgi:hypothetical protein